MKLKTIDSKQAFLDYIIGSYDGPIHTHTLTHLHFLEDDALGVGGTSEGVSLPACSQVGLLVVIVGPSVLTPVLDVLAGSAQSARLTWKKI